MKNLFVMVLGLFLAGCGINNIPSYDENVKAKWSQIDNQYQRRAELIPNLIETVKGYAAHERETLEAVVNARSKASSFKMPDNFLSNPEAFKQFQANQDALSSALSRLLLVVERYPDLKSSQNFLSLQSQLEGTENRIAVARRDYIEAVRLYNTELKTYPGKLWHSFLYSQYVAAAQLTVAEDKKTVPEVKF